MKKRCGIILLSAIIMLSLSAAGCKAGNSGRTEQTGSAAEPDGSAPTGSTAGSDDSAPGAGTSEYSAPPAAEDSSVNPAPFQNLVNVVPTSEILSLEDGFSAVRYDGDYGFEQFLAQGGASSDSEVIQYLRDLLPAGADIGLTGSLFLFGCSTLSVKSPDGDYLFGRNFDWENCSALTVGSTPETGYASISTVNLDFIGEGLISSFPSDEMMAAAALYAPLDGMNEKGLAVSVNMIQDTSFLDQNTDRPDLTTTTAIRLLLNRAANVDEALSLLAQYDLHASMGMTVHFALADADGRSVAVEYVDGKMIVTETPVVTNFYFAPGEKYGIGSAQSHERFDILTERLSQTDSMSMEEVRDALDSVSKDNFGEFESTEWSIVFNQNTGEVWYYHRENYGTCYLFTLETLHTSRRSE